MKDLSYYKKFILSVYSENLVSYELNEDDILFGVFKTSEVIHFIEDNYNTDKEETHENKLNRIIKVVDSVNSNKSFFTLPVTSIKRYFTGVSEQSLLNMILECDSNYDILENRIKYDIKHELGHIIFMKEKYDENCKNGKSMYESMMKSHDYLWQTFKDNNNLEAHKYDKEFLMNMYNTFYTLPIEREANDRANIQTSKYIDALIEYDLIKKG